MLMVAFVSSMLCRPLTNWARGCVSSRAPLSTKGKALCEEKLLSNKEDRKMPMSLETWRTSLAPFPRGILTLMGDIWQTATILLMTWWTRGRVSPFLWIPLCEYFYYVDPFRILIRVTSYSIIKITLHSPIKLNDTIYPLIYYSSNASYSTC